MNRRMRTVLAALCGGYAVGILCVATAAESVLDFNTTVNTYVGMQTGYPTLTNLTLSVWVKTTIRPTSGSYGAIAGRGYLVSTNGFGLYFDGTAGKAVFQARTGGTVVEAGTAYPFDGQWHQLTGVREGITNRIYLDGELAGEATGVLPTLDAPEAAFGLGKAWGNHPYKGAMAEVQLWDHARTQTQIREDLFRRVAAAEPGLAGYWPLDEKSGTTATDRSGAGNNGFISGLSSPSRLTETTGAALLPVSRDSARQGYWPFTLADLDTGGTRFTDSNVVAVTGFRIPAGCDVYQISTSSVASAIVPGNWISTNTPPGSAAFQAEGEGKPAVLFAWFTNSTANVPLRRSAASILYATMGSGVALDFNNARVAMTTNLYSTMTNLTLSVWVKTATVPAANNYGSIAGRGYLSGAVSGFGLFLTYNGNIVFQTRDHDIVNLGASVAYPFDGKWHHLAGVRDGNATRLYFDGSLAAEKTGAITTFFTSGVAFGLGMRHDGNAWGFPFTGAIAEVQLWDQARTQEQIREDMFQCLAGTETGLVGYWPLNEGTGLLVTDWSAAGNNGTRSSSFPSDWVTDIFFGPMLSSSGAYLGYWPITVADLRTGSTRVTDSNAVAVANVSIPAGYDVCQLCASPAVSAVAPGAWGSTNMLSSSLTLSTNVGRVCVYAWFTNTAASVPLRRSVASIVHFPAEAVPDFKESSQFRVEMERNLYLTLTNLTLSAWVKATSKPVPPSTSSENYGAIAGRGYLGGFNGFGLFLSYTGGVSFQTRTGAAIIQADMSYPYDGRWHHLAGVRDGGATRLYIDGVLAAETNGTLSTLAMDGIAFGVGARHDGNNWGFFFDGVIADVRLWNKARAQAQIQEDMFQCLTGTESGLIGYWPLSEGSGTVATDRTNTGNDGVVSASVWLADVTAAVELPASRYPSQQGYWPFALKDLVTSNTNATRSNVVVVAGGLAVPTGYDRYQIGASPRGPESDGEWLSTADQSLRLTLAAVKEGKSGVLFAWFTNTTASVPLRRSGASIVYAPHGESALTFNGDSARLEVGKNLYPALTNLTLSAWIKASAKPSSGSFGSIAGRGYLCSTNGFGLFVAGDGKIYFQTRMVNTAVESAADYPFDGAWHHLAGVRDGNVTRLYLDGVPVAEAEGALSSLYSPGVFFGLGSRHDGNNWGYGFNGILAEVRLWDRARSQKEIRSDMYYRLSGNENGLVGYWPLDEAEWRSSQDRSAMGYDGRVVAAVWDFSADFVRIRPPPGLLIRVF